MAVADACFGGKFAPFGRALGHTNGDALRHIRDGNRPVTEKTLKQVLGLATVKARLRDGTLKAAGFSVPVAHDLSHAAPTLDPTRMEWGDLVKHDELPDEFSLEVLDQAMKGLLAPGDLAFFSKSQAPKAAPGDRVLVVDAAGNGYIRIYRCKTPTHWSAVPLNDDYEPLDSVADELTLVAVMTGLRWASRT